MISILLGCKRSVLECSVFAKIPRSKRTIAIIIPIQMVPRLSIKVFDVLKINKSAIL